MMRPRDLRHPYWILRERELLAFCSCSLLKRGPSSSHRHKGAVDGWPLGKRLEDINPLTQEEDTSPQALSMRLVNAALSSSTNFTWKVSLKCASACRGISNFIEVIFTICSRMELAIVLQLIFRSPVLSAMVFWALSWKCTITFIIPMVLLKGHMKS